MSDGGYIKIFRKLQDWEWYSDPNTKAVFLHCLLMANWEPKRIKGIEYKRGQFSQTHPDMAEKLGLSERQVRTAVEHLTLTGELTVSYVGRNRVITVRNYDQYQSDDRVADRTMTEKRQNSRQDDDSPTLFNKKYKKPRIKEGGASGSGKTVESATNSSNSGDVYRTEFDDLIRANEG